LLGDIYNRGPGLGQVLLGKEFANWKPDLFHILLPYPDEEVKTLFSFLMTTLSQFLSMQGDQMSL
jgi:hypothetical protein